MPIIAVSKRQADFLISQSYISISTGMIASKLPGSRKAFLWFAAAHGIVVEIDHQPQVDDDALDQYRTRAVPIAGNPRSATDRPHQWRQVRIVLELFECLSDSIIEFDGGG